MVPPTGPAASWPSNWASAKTLCIGSGARRVCDPTAWSATWPATIPISSAKQPISSVCICILRQRAAVFCVDEKSAIQALDRLDPVLPMTPGRAERHGFEYYRHGTLSLYAALEVRTGKVVGKTAPRHTSAEFINFLGEVVASAKWAREIHIIL